MKSHVPNHQPDDIDMIFINVPKKPWLMTSMASPIAIHTLAVSQGPPTRTSNSVVAAGECHHHCTGRRKAPCHTCQEFMSLRYVEWFFLEPILILLIWNKHTNKVYTIRNSKGFDIEKMILIPSDNLKLSTFWSVWSARIPWDLQVTNIFDHPGPTWQESVHGKMVEFMDPAWVYGWYWLINIDSNLLLIDLRKLS